jgi:hypothetical protein
MAYTATDRAIELTEPTYEAPPSFRDADERRLHLRAYHHWASLLRGRLLPSPADLDIARLGGLVANAVLLELGAAPLVRFVGERLRAEAGIGEQALPLSSVPEGSVLARLVDATGDVVAKQAPVRVDTEFVSPDGCTMLCRGVLMPLSTDGTRIDALFGVINWKEAAAPELATRIAAEIAGVMGRAGGTMSAAPCRGADEVA